MNNMNRLRIRYLLACMLAAVLGYGSPAIANGPDPSGLPPDFDLVFGAPIACNFDLRIEGWNNGKQNFKEFTDRNGNVRSISAGTGSALRFTNVGTGKTFSTKSNGAVNQIKYNPDGSYIQTMIGHNILILFPTDFPAGPSTTLYVGKVVFEVDINAPNVPTTVINESGNKIDICAAVS